MTRFQDAWRRLSLEGCCRSALHLSHPPRWARHLNPERGRHIVVGLLSERTTQTWLDIKHNNRHTSVEVIDR